MTADKEKKNVTCNYSMHNHKPCGKSLYDNEHCIFHSKDIKGKKTEFNDAFRQEFDRQKAQEDVYDFTGFAFPGEISFDRITFEKKVYFDNSRFSGKVIFDKAQFPWESSFSKIQFSRGTSFWSTQFSGRTDFGGCRFYKNADFRQVDFSEDASFGKAIFSGRADFWDAQFHKKADFNRARFDGEAVFKEAKFDGETVFMETNFFEKVSFWEATFSKGTDFVRSQFYAEASFAGVLFSGVINFKQSQFHKKAKFNNVGFEDGRNCYMEETYFDDIGGLLEYLEENKKKKKKNFEYSHKTEFLPDNFRLILGERAAAKYPLFNRKIRDDMYLLNFKTMYPKIHFLWWLFADCGRKLRRWASWSFGAAIFFALIYIFVMPGAFKTPQESTWFSFVYFSFVTFTTLGFGDITPIKWYAEILVTLEVILGYGMLGGLISILANKLARRS